MGRYKVVRVNGRIRNAHIVVWEKATGQSLPKGWDIHHKDGDGNNNAIENLVAMPHGEHISLHNKLRAEGNDPVNSSDPEVIHARMKSKKSREKNREKIALHKHEYYLANAEKLRTRNREYMRRKRVESGHVPRSQRCKIPYEVRYPLILAKQNLNYARTHGFPNDEITRREAIVADLSEKIKCGEGMDS